MSYNCIITYHNREGDSDYNIDNNSNNNNSNNNNNNCKIYNNKFNNII